MLSFLAGSFAVAGAILALGPVLVHLLNRRRYRVVPWAAMELLSEAVARTRRMLRVRDWLLLALRTLSVLLFGLALARPYFSTSGQTVDPLQPVHAVLIVDNSLSMSYGELHGTLLDQARARAVEFVDRLPEESRISIVPLCGSIATFDREAYRSAGDAREALARIEVADRTGTVAEAIALARDACARVPELPAKRIVFLGDQQEVAWPAAGLEAALRELPEFQVVPVQAVQPENAWVDGFRVEDDIADARNPAMLAATIRYEGTAIRKDVKVALEVDGISVAGQIVDLIPGQARQVRFTHQFTAPAESGRQTFVPAAVVLTPDRLPLDDTRCLAVPVVAALPVVFVDQYGAAGENPRQNRYGETYHLRRLLAPAAGRRNPQQPLIGVRHVTIDELDAPLLRDARLVVIAGVESPGAAVPLLREYVEQGGQLLIAAGGRFSPANWSLSAWLDGAGILPAPLDAAFVGRLPDDNDAPLDPFFLAPATMADEFFDMDGAGRSELEELYRTPVFFRAVVARPGDAPPESFERVLSHREGELPAGWLGWRIERETGRGKPAGDGPASSPRPRVLAAFTNRHPFLVERRIGEGNVVFVASSVGSNWNNLPRTNAILLLDRLLRQMMGRTLPRRDFATYEQVTVPVRDEDRRADFRLERPDGPPESLAVGAVGAEQFAVVLSHLERRGTYRLVAERASGAPRATGGEVERLWEIPLSVNGPAQESELAAIDEGGLRRRIGAAAVHWVAPGDAIRLEGADVRGRELWKWLLWGTLGVLLCETACLAITRQTCDETRIPAD